MDFRLRCNAMSAVTQSTLTLAREVANMRLPVHSRSASPDRNRQK
jgi:hypothetical protein